MLYLNNSAKKFFSEIAIDSLKNHIRFSEDGSVLEAVLHEEEERSIIKVVKEGSLLSIECHKKHFMRALGIAVKNARKKSFVVTEKPRFNDLTFLIDCSRNGVINFDFFKDVTVKLALLGYNSIQIYMEDTLELEGEPYFGHLRGRYSVAELKKMDEFAAACGIELVPYIQTLAHFDNIFLWPEYDKVWDIYNTILIGEDKTYKLIEKIFRTLRSALKTKKVNIGFDEAHSVLRGRYADKNGYPKNKFKIVCEHLERVVCIAEKFGFRPSMWSDMFFRLCYDGEYHVKPETSSEPLKKIKKYIPENVDLIYWDYYHDDETFYDSMFKKHKVLRKNVRFACGIWKWLGYAPLNDYGIKRIVPGLRSAINNKVSEVIVTSWGDNGNEAPLMSTIPQIVVAAEYAYKNKFNLANVKKSCKELFFAVYEDFIALDLPNRVNYEFSENYGCNPSKYLLYNDPVYGLFDYHTDETYCDHYKKCVTILKKAVRRNPDYREVFALERTLCDYLGVKANFGNTLRSLYLSGDKEGLKSFAGSAVPLAVKKLDAFIAAVRKSWLKENKIFGLDELEIRLGGQRQRLSEIAIRIKEYIDGKTTELPELTQTPLSFACGGYEDKDICKGLYAYMATPSFSLERY